MVPSGTSSGLIYMCVLYSILLKSQWSTSTTPVLYDQRSAQNHWNKWIKSAVTSWLICDWITLYLCLSCFTWKAKTERHFQNSLHLRADQCNLARTSLHGNMPWNSLLLVTSTHSSQALLTVSALRQSNSGFIWAYKCCKTLTTNIDLAV